MPFRNELIINVEDIFNQRNTIRDVINETNTFTGVLHVDSEISSLSCRLQCLEELVSSLSEKLDTLENPEQSIQDSIALFEVLNGSYIKKVE